MSAGEIPQPGSPVHHALDVDLQRHLQNLGIELTIGESQHLASALLFEFTVDFRNADYKAVIEHDLAQRGIPHA